MQIHNNINQTAVQNAPGKAAKPVSPPAPPAAVEQAGSRASEQLDTLQIAQDAVRQTAPEFDVGRVAEIKAAMQRGEIRFDADRVAALIMSVHGSGR
ncbi:flagellar biosynthesis anti-sigma factor FlgM [Dyella koreensis]|uniref:Negative regulator of flagellin synthesis n=1 Tax=Dyella koreensis TaxID=311235 RepID=A0ABW8K7K2_9GAMM